jgi:hypothetical protein
VPHFQTICYLSLCHDFALHSGGETDIYLVFSVFTSRPISLLASTRTKTLVLSSGTIEKHPNGEVIQSDRETKLLCSRQSVKFYAAPRNLLPKGNVQSENWDKELLREKQGFQFRVESPLQNFRIGRLVV